jgi:Zn finger protein HypA/HybF involved in hydrogenase expression
MRKIVEPPPTSQCEQCGGPLTLKGVNVAQSALGLVSQVYVCEKCKAERAFVAAGDTYAPRTNNEQRYG